MANEVRLEQFRLRWSLPSRWRTHWLGLMIWGTILFPPMAWPGKRLGLPDIRWEEILLIIGLLLNALWSVYNRKRIQRGLNSTPFIHWRGEERKLYLALFAFVITIILADIYGRLFLGIPFTFRDSMEFVTIAKYSLLLMIGASIDPEPATLRTLLIYFLSAFFMLNFVSWAQAENWFDINHWLTPWMAPAHLGNLTKAAIPRVLGTFDNPNVTGIFVALIFIFAADLFLLGYSRGWFFIALLAAKLQVMVISRGAMLAMGLGFIVLLFHLSIWKKENHQDQAQDKAQNQNQKLRRLLVLLIGTAAVFVLSPHFFFQRVTEGAHLTTSSSVNQHFELWRVAWEKIKVSPILGWGTAKGAMTTLVDNEFLLIWRRYGLIGLGAYAGIYYRFWHLGYSAENKAVRVGLPAALAAVMIFNFSVGTWYNLQFMSLLFIAFGIQLSVNRKAPYAANVAPTNQENQTQGMTDA